MTIPTADKTPEPLLDLSRLVAGVRWRRRLWLSLAGAGVLVGLATALLAPSPATASARIYVVHEGDSDGGESAMKTDLAVLETTTVAAEAVQRLHIDTPPEQFVGVYYGEIVAGNVLQIVAEGSDDQQAVDRVHAVADAFIAVHIKITEDPAQAETKALNDRRSELQTQLDAINAQVAVPAQPPGKLQALLDRQAVLSSQIADLTQRAEISSLGSPRLVAGTRIIDAPRPTSRSTLRSVALLTGAGLLLGLGLGIAVAAVATVVRDLPVLRRDIATHLGASVIAQLPAPFRGPSRLWRRGHWEEEGHRTAATLVRLVRAGSRPVSILELGCDSVAARLAMEVAVELGRQEPVLLVDDLPGHELRWLGRPAGSVQVVEGRQFPDPQADPRPQERQLAVGTVRPGAPWTDLRRLGAETLVILRAGSAEAAWLHTVGRQLADAGIAVIGVVVVHPDPRDRSDGTLWNAVHTAIRGRLAAATSSGLIAHDLTGADGLTSWNGAAGSNGRDAPRVLAIANGAAFDAHVGDGVRLAARTEWPGEIAVIDGAAPGEGTEWPEAPDGHSDVEVDAVATRTSPGPPTRPAADAADQPPASPGPAEEVPEKASTPEEASTEEVPEKTSTEDTPLEEAPTNEAPVDQAPTNEAPVGQAPVDQAPVDQGSGDQASVTEAPPEEASPEVARTDEGSEEVPPVAPEPAEAGPMEVVAERPDAEPGPVSDQESGTGGSAVPTPGAAALRPRRRPRPRLRSRED